MNAAYDVVVVGAGPAGSTAARLASQAGLKTLLIEKRQEIGAPVRCAEAVGADLLKQFITPNPRWIEAEISSFAVRNSVGDVVKLPPAEPTLVVNRKVFDYQLALEASRAGAEVRTATAAVGLVMQDKTVRGVRLERMGREEVIRTRLVVAADGVESQVARWAGINITTAAADFFSGIEFLLAGDDVKKQIDPDTCEYLLDQNLAPGGYAWVFPKGEDSANVGLVIPSNRTDETRPLTALERYVERRFPDASVMAVVAGGIPASGALKTMTADGLVLVGDAARQADPLTAGGINLGMIGAELAMQAAIPALMDGEATVERLRSYENAWQQRFGKMHAALHQVRKIITHMDPARLDEIIRHASQMPLQQLSLGQIMLELLKNDPRLLFEARTLISTGLILK